MTRAVGLALLTGLLGAQAASGQVGQPRSRDYLFVSSIDDARALWVNPGGLHMVTEASVLGEAALERPIGGGLRLSQLTVGFNSRGLSFGYQRDRLGDDSSTPLTNEARSAEAFRFGAAFKLQRGGLGIAMTLHRTGIRDRGAQRSFDIGAEVALLRSLTAGAVLRNIGRPHLDEGLASRPLEGVLGVSWRTLSSHATLSAEGLVAERPGETGYDVGYRAGAKLSIGWPLGLGLVTALSLADNLEVDAWTVGLSIGGRDRLIGLVSGIPTAAGSTHLERISLTGSASRRAPTP